jgi:hypothetical protein
MPSGPVADRAMEGIVQQLIREQFPDRNVDRVFVEGDEDSDGDAVLRITVVVERATIDLDRSTLVGLTRLLRSKLIEANITAFPVLSFVTKGEANALKIAPS